MKSEEMNAIRKQAGKGMANSFLILELLSEIEKYQKQLSIYESGEKKMKKWHIYGVVTGTKYMGMVHADTEKEAQKRGMELDSGSVTLCHHCAEQCSDPEIQDVNVEEEL